MLEPNLDGLQNGSQKPIETSVTEFLLQKREFISQGTQEHYNNTFSNT